MSLTLTSFLQFVTVFLLLSWALYLVYRVGQIYNGPVFTMLIGAYFSAYVVRDLNWPFGLALLTSMLIGAVASFIPALRLARASAFATAIATIALVFIGQAVIRNLGFLGGSFGFFHIPTVDYLLPISYIAVSVIGFLIYRLDHSRVGRAMEMTFADPDLSAATGIDIFKLRVWLQTIAGTLGSLAGVFYAFHVHTIFVTDFGLDMLLASFCFLFVGGYTTMWGPVFFTPVLWSISIFLPAEIATWKGAIYGILLIAVLVIHPSGLIDKRLIRIIRSKCQSIFSKRVNYQIEEARNEVK